MLNPQKSLNELGSVIGLKSTDRLLVGGALSPAQIKKHLLTGDQFDRIILYLGKLSEEVIIQAIQLLAPGGLLALVGEQKDTIEVISRNYPRANVWSLRSTIGLVLLTDARGQPEGV